MFSGLNYSGMQQEAYRGLPEVSTTGMYDANDIKAWINEGCLKISELTECYERKATWQSVLYQRNYVLPSDMLRPKAVFYRQAELDPVDYNEIDWDAETPTTPKKYCLYEGNLLLEKIPCSGAIATTLATATSGGNTTFTVADASILQRRGALTINSEVLYFDHRNGSGIYSVSHSKEGTTASSCLSGATVTERCIEMPYFAMPASLTSGDDVSVIPHEFHFLPPEFARIKAFTRDGKYQAGGTEEQKWFMDVRRMNSKRKNKTRDKLPKTKDKAKRMPA